MTRHSPSLYLLPSSLLFFILLTSSCATICELTNEIVPVQAIGGQFVLKDHDSYKLELGQGMRNKGSLRRNIDNNMNHTEKLSTFFHARKCPCAMSTVTTYCLLTSDNENRCKVSENSSPLCYSETSYDYIIRTFWPVVVLWYAAVALYFSISAPRTTKFQKSTCVPLLSGHKGSPVNDD